MASQISIAVTLDDKGVVTGVKNINSSIDQMGSGLQKTGQRGNVVFTELTKQQKEAHEAGMLLNNTLGIQMPRALENVLSKLPGLGSLLATAFKASVVAAVLGVVIDLIPKIQELGSEMGGFTKEMRNYNEEAAKASRQAFVNPRNITDARANLAFINQQLKEKQRIVDSLQKEDEFTQRLFGYNKSIAENENQMVALRQQQVDLTDDLTKKTAALNAANTALFGQAGSAGLTGAAAVRQNLVTELAKIDEQFKGAVPGGPEADLAENSRIIARLKAAREIGAIDRQQADATRALLNESMLLEFRDRDQVVEKYRQTVQEINILESRGDLTHTNAEQRRIAAAGVENDALIKLAYARTDRIAQADNAARDEGLKGINAIVAAQREAIDQIHKELERGEIDQDEASKREVDINIKTKKQIIENERQTALTIRGLHDQTLQSEERAATAALPQWARANAQIVNDQKDRVRQIDDSEKDLLRNVQANSDEYVRITQEAQRERVAVWKETNAKLVDEHKRVVDQMAGQLESLFSGNIAQNILGLVKKFAFKIVAEFLTHFSALQNGFGGIFQKLFGGGGIASGGSGGGFSLGSLLGIGGSSSGGGAAVTGSGVNSNFIGSLGLGGSSSSGSAGASQIFGGALGRFGPLVGAGIFGGLGLLFSSAIGSILTPEPSKDQIAATVLQADQASLGGLQGLIQAVRDGKIADFSAMQKIQYAWGMAHNKEAYFNPGQVGDLDRSFQALLDQVKDAEIDHKRTLNPGYATGAAQFHDGGFTGNASMRLSSNEIHAILRDDEFVVNPRATRMHRGTLERMNDGSYSGGGHTFVIQTLDPRTMEHWLRTGGAEMIAKGLSLHISEGGPRRG